jgi:hypothetical protein
MTGYCPDHDPILVVGHLTCLHCKAASWPADAEWVAHDLILASFSRVHEPGCAAARSTPETVLIQVSAADAGVCDPPQRTRAEVAVICGTTCAATVRHGHRKGQRCRNRPKQDGLCAQHLEVR